MIDLGKITITEIVAAAAVVKALWMLIEGVYDKLFKPGKDNKTAIEDIRKDLTTIKSDISEIKEKQTSDYETLHNHAERLGKLEERQDDFREFLSISLDAQRALLEHAVDGNNTEAMKRSLAEIDRYLKKHL